MANNSTPSAVLFRPRIFIDGNQWCALYGDNIQDGVAGFGDSPDEAMAEFDKAWRAALIVRDLHSSDSGKADK